LSGSREHGILIFEAEDGEAARRIIAEEPVTGAGHMRAELRPFRLGILRDALSEVRG
jgi:hypothetical protein